MSAGGNYKETDGRRSKKEVTNSTTSWTVWDLSHSVPPVYTSQQSNIQFQSRRQVEVQISKLFHYVLHLDSHCWWRVRSVRGSDCNSVPVESTDGAAPHFQYFHFHSFLELKWIPEWEPCIYYATHLAFEDPFIPFSFLLHVASHTTHLFHGYIFWFSGLVSSCSLLLYYFYWH